MVDETRPGDPFAPLAPPPPVADQFGYGYQQANPPLQPQSYPPAYPPPYQPAKHGLPGWGIALIACAAGLVVVLIVAAVAIPVFLGQRDKATAAATTISVPPGIGELTQTPMTPEMQAQAQAWRQSMARWLPDPQAAIFVDAPGSHRLVVLAGKMSTVLHQDDQTEVVRGFWHGAEEGLAGQAVLGVPAERSPGELGGTMSCASFNPAGVTGEICIAVDPGSMVVTVDIQDGAGATTDPNLFTAVREAVVHRS
jgi:hypothetical protein